MATYSRAATVNGYAALASYIQRQSTFVAGLAAAGTEPTAPQLARFQSRTTGVLRRLTDGAPPPVAALAEQLCDAVGAACARRRRSCQTFPRWPSASGRWT